MQAASVKIKELHLKFQEKIALITSYQQAARSLAHSELANHRSYFERFPEQQGTSAAIMSSSNFSYPSPIDGKSYRYGRKTMTLEEMIVAIQLHQNRQYQWLLAEAYEELEDFIEAAYACAGLFDNSFWLQADYGGTSAAELPTADSQWYLEKARSKKGGAEAILKQFRKKIPKFEILEQKNALQINLRLAFALVAQLRHHIVHTAGRVKDREIFATKVLANVGLLGNGKPKAEHRNFVEAYFYLSEPYDDTISLLDVDHADSRPGLRLHVSIFDRLVGWMLAIGHLLTDALVEHQASEALNGPCT